MFLIIWHFLIITINEHCLVSNPVQFINTELSIYYYKALEWEFFVFIDNFDLPNNQHTWSNFSTACLHFSVCSFCFGVQQRACINNSPRDIEYPRIKSDRERYNRIIMCVRILAYASTVSICITASFPRIHALARGPCNVYLSLRGRVLLPCPISGFRGLRVKY